MHVVYAYITYTADISTKQQNDSRTDMLIKWQIWLHIKLKTSFNSYEIFSGLRNDECLSSKGKQLIE